MILIEKLYLIKELHMYGYSISFLSILSVIAIITAILVILNNNPIISILFLISLFGIISIYLVMINNNFIALSYLIIYVGAVSILFIFILMLINIRNSELQNDSWNGLSLGVFISIIFSYIYIDMSYYNVLSINFDLDLVYLIKLFFQLTSKDIMYIQSNSWDSNLLDLNHIFSIGNILYTDYSILIILISLILLLAMVGTIAITKSDLEQKPEAE